MQMDSYNAVLGDPGWNKKVTIDRNIGKASGTDLEDQGRRCKGWDVFAEKCGYSLYYL